MKRLVTAALSLPGRYRHSDRAFCAKNSGQARGKARAGPRIAQERFGLIAALGGLGLYTVPTMLYPLGVVATWLFLNARTLAPGRRAAKASPSR